MEKHPIESLMGVSMEQIKDMVDVNTVIGDAVQTQDGSTIIPISRVSFGFVAGGGEYAVSGAQAGAYGLPFAGGAGAGVSLSPAAFLLVGNGQIRCIPVQNDLILQIGECLRQFTERKEGEGC